MCVSMRRISVTIPEKIAEALERVVRIDPSKPPKSRVVSDALSRYIGALYPELLHRGNIKGPTVLTAIRLASPRAPSPTLRKTRLALPKWSKIES